MIVGYSTKFIIESIMMIIIIFTYANKKILFIPKVNEIFKDFKEIILFSINYSIGYYAFAVIFEVISFILIKTENGKQNLTIWVALSLPVDSIYFIGYGMGNYGRALGNHFIGTGNIERFKKTLNKCIIYQCFLTYILVIPLFFFAPFIGCLLYTSPSPRDGLLSRMPSSA